MSTKLCLGLVLLLVVALVQSSIRVYLVAARYNARFLQEEQSSALYKALNQVADMRAMGQEELLVDALLTQQMKSFEGRLHFRSKTLLVLLSPQIPLAILVAMFAAIASSAWRLGELLPAEIFSLLLLCFAMAYAVARLIYEFSAKIPEEGSLRQELAHAVKKPVIQIPATSNERLKLQDVSFCYRGSRNDIFTGIDLTIRRGELLAVVGAPLGGVSTLLRLIGGKLMPISGTIIHFIDDAPLRIALIDDAADLFAGSLKDNITLLNSRFLEEDIVLALARACALDLFYNRPQGLLMPILSHGSNLSAGEKQRLLLAQAMLHKPDVIVLDNFFDKLDQETAEKILGNLLEFGSSVVLSSYRSNELAKCHRIVYIKNNNILISDNHEHLLATSKDYRDLVILPSSEASV